MMMTEEEAAQALAHEEGNLSSSSSSSGSPHDHKLPEGTDGTNLIINYIPILYTENELRSLFQTYGQVEKCKIVYDKFTNQSLGYGFIKYDNPDSAITSINALNGHQVQNKRLKVSIAKPPEKEIKSNLYISGLPLDFTQQDLKDLVLQFGAVLEARVLYDLSTRKCRGVGFARLDSQKNALAAIAGLTGSTLDGGTMPLIVKFADTTNDKARKLQKKYGPFAQFQAQAQAQQRQQQQFQTRTSFSTDPYVNVNVPSSAPSVPSYGYSSPPTILQQATLPPTTFLTQTQAYSPIQSPQQLYQQPGLQTQSQSIYQNTVTASPYRQPQQQQQYTTQRSIPSQLNSLSMSLPSSLPSSTSSDIPKENFTGICLFVYHLPPDASESSLFTLFSNYGQVTNAKIMRDLNTGRNKGFGFVNMGNEQQAQMAINALNGFQMGNKFLKVSFKNDRAQSGHHHHDL